MQNEKQLLNKENWIKYLDLAKDGELTNNAIANDIVAKIKKALNIYDDQSPEKFLAFEKILAQTRAPRLQKRLKHGRT